MMKLAIFRERLKKLGIYTQFTANHPWIYLDTINDKKVKEKFEGNHGFTIGFMTANLIDGIDFNFTDLNEIFKIIRKYR